MKKFLWISVVLVMLLSAIFITGYGFWIRNFQIIEYCQRSYRSSDGSDFFDLTKEQVETRFYLPIYFSGEKYGGREVWVSGKSDEVAETIIFLKQKKTDRFDVYSLQGGP